MNRQYKSIVRLRALNRSNGYHFFEQDTLRFFDSIIYKPVRTIEAGWLFITSERFKRTAEFPRMYTIRLMNDSGSVDTIGEFQQYDSFESAVQAMNTLAKEDRQ